MDVALGLVGACTCPHRATLSTRQHAYDNAYGIGEPG